MLKLYLIRHGECEMNLALAERIGGRSNNSPLTPLGREQAQCLGIHLCSTLSRHNASPQEMKFYTSTAVRSLDTARMVLIALQVDKEQLQTSDLLLEQDMGEWEGALRKDCYTEHNLQLIKADTHNFCSPGGESQKHVEDRMIAFITEKVLPETQPGQPSFIFGHGMAFKTVLRYLLNSDANMTRKIALCNTSVTELGYVKENKGDSGGMQPGWHILRVNDTSHLPVDMKR